jgi:hypothetical protein
MPFRPGRQVPTIPAQHPMTGRVAHRLPPKTIALWRYEQIREALGEGLSREVINDN